MNLGKMSRKKVIAGLVLMVFASTILLIPGLALADPSASFTVQGTIGAAPDYGFVKKGLCGNVANLNTATPFYIFITNNGQAQAKPSNSDVPICVTLCDQNGNPVGERVQAAIGANQKYTTVQFTFRNPGIYKIRVEGNAGKGGKTIWSNAFQVGNVLVVEPSFISLGSPEQGRERIYAKLMRPDGTWEDVSVLPYTTWSVSNDYTSVTQETFDNKQVMFVSKPNNGKYGTTIVTATYVKDGIRSSASAEVLANQVRLTLTPQKAQMTVGEEIELVAQAYVFGGYDPKTGNAIWAETQTYYFETITTQPENAFEITQSVVGLSTVFKIKAKAATSGGKITISHGRPEEGRVLIADIDVVAAGEMIRLTPDYATLKKGETLSYLVEYYNGTTKSWENVTDKVSWTLSSGGVASVNSDGVVTALNKGNAVITATYTINGKKYSKSASLTVEEEVPQIVQGIEIKPAIGVLYGDKVLQLYAYDTLSKEEIRSGVTWSVSSNEWISVDGTGKVSKNAGRKNDNPMAPITAKVTASYTLGGQSFTGTAMVYLLPEDGGLIWQKEFVGD